MRHCWQVGIVGAGPAGARAAELLAGRGVDVVLLDPRVPWEKPCGGGLTASLLDQLPELGEVKELARPINRARLELGSRHGVEVALIEPIWMVSRRALGRWQLARALEAGAAHEPAKVRSLGRACGGRNRADAVH